MGSTGGSPARLALRVLYSASLIWMCAESRSIMSASEQVAAVAYTGPEKPFFASSGRLPEWSMCACVSSAKSTSAGETGRVWFTNMSRPCSMPQSTMKRVLPTSTSVQLPVTSCAAPRNVIFNVCLPSHSSSLSTARNASVGICTVPSWRIFFLPSFCFSSSFFFRVMSPP